MADHFARGRRLDIGAGEFGHPVGVEPFVEVLPQRVWRLRIDEFPARASVDDRPHAASGRIERHAEELVLDAVGLGVGRDPTLGRPIGGDESAVAQRRQVLGHETQPSAVRRCRGGPSAGHIGHGRGGVGPRNVDRPVALPGERIEDHDPRTGNLDRGGQTGHATVDRRIDQPGGTMRVGPLLSETFEQEAVVACGQLLPPLVAVVVTGIPVDVRPPGMLAEKERLLIGFADGRARRTGRDAPDGAERIERFQRGDAGPCDVGQLRFDRHRADPMDPRVRHVAPNDRQLRLLAQDGLAEVRHLPEADPNARQVALGPREQIVDLPGVRWAVVVTGHPHAQPCFVGPVGRRLKARSILGRKHGQQTRSVGPFPPEQQRDIGMRAARVAANVEELHPRVCQDCGHRPSVGRHVGHFGPGRKWLARQACQFRGIQASARQVLQIQRLGVRGERQCVRNQATGTHGRQEAIAPLGRLIGPEHLGHGPAGQAPGELLVRGQTGTLVDQLQGLVGHRRPVAIHHLTGQVGVTDVEMGLGNDDHFRQVRPRRRRLRPGQRRSDDGLLRSSRRSGLGLGGLGLGGRSVRSKKGRRGEDDKDG